MVGGSIDFGNNPLLTDCTGSLVVEACGTEPEECEPENTITQTVYISSEADLQQLVGICRITGSLVIESQDPQASLSSLSLPDLRSLGESLHISFRSLTSLDLSSLESAGSISIQGNYSFPNSGLLSVDLSFLKSTGSISIQNNSSTNSPNSGLGSVDLSSLESAGSISIENNLYLTSLDLSSLESAAGNVNVSNTALTSLSFPELTSLNSLSISSNSVLAFLSLPLLESVPGTINISGNAALVSCEGDAILEVGDCSAAGGEIDPEICGTTSFVFEGDYIITTETDIENLAGVCGITGNLSIEQTSLSSMSFPYLKAVAGTLQVTENSDLTDLNLSELIVAGELVIGSNAILESVNLAALVSVGGQVAIGYTNLVTLSLPSLTSVGSHLIVLDNAVLTTLSIPSLSAVGGLTLINNNLVLTSCEGDAIEGVGNCP